MAQTQKVSGQSVVMTPEQRELMHRLRDRFGIRVSPRELEVLCLMVRRLSNSEIGRRLSIAEGTVKQHAKNIFEANGFRTRKDTYRLAGILGIPLPVPVPTLADLVAFSSVDVSRMGIKELRGRFETLAGGIKLIGTTTGASKRSRPGGKTVNGNSGAGDAAAGSIPWEPSC